MKIIISSIQNSVNSNVIYNVNNVLLNNISNWKLNFKELYKQIIFYFGNDTFMFLLNQKALKRFDINKDIENYINYFTGKKIKYINDTTRDEIKNIISNNLKNGSGILKIENDIKNKYKDFAKGRSKLIAVTEVAGISNYASLQGALQLDDNIYKKWKSILDKKTRDTHKNMNYHEAIKLNESFNVGSTKLLFPGDPSGNSNEIIGCRCSLIFIKK